MISDRLTISPDLSIRSFCGSPAQLKLARNHRLREITFADEIRHHVNFANRFGIEQKQRITQARFLFPERALHLSKNLPTPNLRRMLQRRRARIRVHGRAVRNNQERAVFIGTHANSENLQQPALSASRMGPTSNVQRSIRGQTFRREFLVPAVLRYSCESSIAGQTV